MPITSQKIEILRGEGPKVPLDRSAEIVQRNVVAVFSLIDESFRDRNSDISINFEPKKSVAPHFCMGPDSTSWVHLHIFDKEKLGTGLIAEIFMQEGEFQIGPVYGEPHPIAFPIFVSLNEKGFGQLEEWVQRETAALMKKHEREVVSALDNISDIRFGIAAAKNDNLEFLIMYDREFGIDANRIPADLTTIIGQNFTFRT